MVHTAEIIYHMYDYNLVRSFFDGFGFPSQEQANLSIAGYRLNDDGKKISIPCSMPAVMDVGDMIPGIKNIRVRRHFRGEYTITIRLEPNKLILGHNTVDVFKCTSANKDMLADVFYRKLADVIGDDYPEVLDISNWDTKRIDYTYNIQLADSDKVEIFERITKRTNKPRYTSKVLTLRDEALYEQSTSQGCKSWKALLYDKMQQIQDEYTGIPGQEKQCLLQAAEGIIRFEVQCDTGKINNLYASTKEFTPSTKKFVDFLNENVASVVLFEKYSDLVGWGDFYSLDKATEIINKSDMSKSNKTKLINFLRLASQHNGMQSFKDAFIGGATLKRYKDSAGNAIYVKGSNGTYKSRVKALLNLGINPMPIAKIQGMDFFPNPLKPKAFAPC